MKIAYVFAKAQTFDFAMLSRGQFLANDCWAIKKIKIKGKKQILKSIGQGHIQGTLSRFLLCLVRGHPKTRKQEQSDNDGYRRLFEKQKQKHTIANTDF